MRKLNLCLVLFLLLAAPAFAASVSRSMPTRAEPGATFTVTFSITSAIPNELFTLEDQLPSGWTIKGWSVTGSTEAKEQISTSFNPPRYGWSFTPSGSSATISYTVTAPSTEGTYSFDAVWFDRNGQSRGTQAVVVKAIRCGDGICEGTENSGNCAQDCPVATTTLPQATITSAPTTTTQLTAAELPKANMNTWLIVLLIIILIALLIFLFSIRKKRRAATSFPEFKDYKI